MRKQAGKIDIISKYRFPSFCLAMIRLDLEVG